jgi:CO dehydrogenase maturation factor
MSYLIAVTGKGGVGKTSLSALIVRRLIARGRSPVLAVDADPNSCLDAALGVIAPNTIGRAREEAGEEARKGLGAGIPKQELLGMKIEECLVESEDFDYLAMGRPEGPGCYCYANNVLRQALGEISSAYPSVVVDNEAGLENLSRRIVVKVDALVLVTDPSQAGAATVERLASLAREMGIECGKIAIAVNRVRGKELPPFVTGLKEAAGADVLAALPYDDETARLGEEGMPLSRLPADNPFSAGVDALLEALLS